MGIVIGVIIVLFLIFIIMGTKGNSMQKDFEGQALEQIKTEGISFSKQTKTEYGIIGIDEPKKLLVIINSEITIRKIIEIPFGEIISCELAIDGQSVYKKSALRTIGGAVAGGAIFGGAGAIVGGLSSSYKENKNIKKVEIKIVSRNISNPSCRMTFFSSGTNSTFLKMRLGEAEIWKDTISAIIDIEDRANKQI